MICVVPELPTAGLRCNTRDDYGDQFQKVGREKRSFVVVLPKCSKPVKTIEPIDAHVIFYYMLDVPLLPPPPLASCRL